LKWVFNLEFTYDPATFVGKLVLIATLAPLIGAIASTSLTNGKAGLQKFLVRAFCIRFNVIWCVAAIFIPVLVLAANFGTVALLERTRIPEKWFAPMFPLPFLFFFIAYIGVGEETGWRGFATPWLQARFGSLGGGIMTGIIWSFWHIPLFLMPGSVQYGSSMVSFTSTLICWSVVMAMLANKARGSVWVAILFHAAVNFIAFTSQLPGRYENIYWAVAAALAVVGLPKPLFSGRR
jgi:membrane protease YdiL (CAAX protease family)